MFEFLKNFMVRGNAAASPNSYFPVEDASIAKAEQRLGFKFPSQLRAFYQEIGSGFLIAAPSDEKTKMYNYINRFIGPGEVADLLSSDNEMAPSEGFDTGEIPFFEIGDKLYLVIRSTDAHPNQVCWPFGDVVTPDLIAFTTMLAQNPRFYHALS